MVKVGFAGNSSEFIWVSLRISEFRLQEWAAMARRQHNDLSSIISVKASQTRMIPSLAAGCGALSVTLLSAEPEREWTVGDELPLFTSSRSVGVETRRF